MSFLPDARERDLLQFHVARSLSYQSRVGWAAALILGGVVLEVLLPFPYGFVGVAPFFGAGLLLAAGGYTNKPEVTGAGFWKTAKPAQLERILELHQRSSSWDFTALDISNLLGFLAFAAVLAASLALGALAAQLTGLWAFPLVAASAAALFFPLWFTGLRAGYSNAQLILKTKLLRELLSFYETMKQPGENAAISLKLNGPETEAVPQDLKLQITCPDAGPDFYGLQGQVNVNVVQGRKYPYCYFVVVAKRGANIESAARGLERRGEILVETKRQNDVELIIVRQHTTRTSGYHTKMKRCVELLEVALQAARRTAKLISK